MKRMMIMLAMAALASALAVGAADARGGGGSGHGGGFGGRFGGGFRGGMATRGSSGEFGGARLGFAGRSYRYGAGIHDRGLHRYGRYWPGYAYYYGDPDCYDWFYLHPGVTPPLSCS